MNRENLQKLATYLAYADAPMVEGNGPVEFDMGSYSQYGDGAYELMTDCGTVGCAAGWGPFAGIEKDPRESFREYCERAFGLRFPYATWIWCFNYDWRNVDNTREGAAKRIQYLLIHGDESYGLKEIRNLYGWDGRKSTSDNELRLLIELYRNIEVAR
jgi:hypothetical protein